MSSDSFSRKDINLGLDRKHAQRPNQYQRASRLAEAAQAKKEAIYKVCLIEYPLNNSNKR
jgi:hypothetical protein